MDYSIYKDDNVVSTVDKIIKILDSVGIQLDEDWNSVPSAQNYMPGYSNYPSNCDFLPYSLRVFLFGRHEIGTNGKGTTKENARASAYAEFIERLQNQYLPKDCLFLHSDRFSFAPDEKEIGKETEEFLSKYNYTKILSYCQPDRFNNIPVKKVCIPYYNIKEKKLNYLPPLHFIFTTNGMAAGNTPEEALVQGFSEICERYSHKQIFFNNISMPDVPKEYYEQYDTIKGLIDYTEQLGWKVSVKDASLGEGLPTICTIFENPTLGIFTYQLGSQPSLPIAIERNLTEFFQGGIPKDCELINKIFPINDYSKQGLKDIFTDISRRRRYFRISDKIHGLFLDRTPDYEFSPSAWIDEDRKYTNKELLKILVDKVSNLADNEILVRDVSFLGFPAYHIFVPDFSGIEFYDDDKMNRCCWGNYPEKTENVPDDVDSLISAILFKLKYEPNYSVLVPYTPEEYLLILCYMLKGDVKNVLKYCEALGERKEPDDVTDFVSENHYLINIIYQYFKLKKQKVNPAEIDNIINRMHNKEEIQKFYDLINNLSLDYIKKIIAEAKGRLAINKKMEKTSEEIDRDNKIANVKQRMIEKYIENTPDQMKLAEVFDFL